MAWLRVGSATDASTNQGGLVEDQIRVGDLPVDGGLVANVRFDTGHCCREVCARSDIENPDCVAPPRRLSTRCPPMNPAPPVATISIGLVFGTEQ